MPEASGADEDAKTAQQTSTQKAAANASTN